MLSLAPRHVLGAFFPRTSSALETLRGILCAPVYYFTGEHTVDYRGQPYKLKGALKEAGVTHGFEGEVTLRNVRLMPYVVGGKTRKTIPTRVFFCPMGDIKQSVTLGTTTVPGDGGELCGDVVIDESLMKLLPTDRLEGLVTIDPVFARTNGRTVLSAKDLTTVKWQEPAVVA